MFSFLAALVLAISSASANPAVSPNTGMLGAQVMRVPKAGPTVVQFINNTDAAIELGFSYRTSAGSGGVPRAVVTEGGVTQCVYVAGPTGTRCASVLAPGERGWVDFGAVTLVSVTVTRYSMSGLDIESPGVVPGTTLPAIVLGDPYHIMQGALATQVAKSTCDVDLRVRGANTLFVGMCR
jgi:hypothetical protein